MGGYFGEFTQAWIRGLLLLVLLVPVLIWRGWWRPIRQQDLGWFLGIAVAGGLNQAPYFYAFQHISVGTATVLFYAGLTIAGYLVGWRLFAEKIGADRMLALGLAMVGVGLLFGFELQPTQIMPGLAALVAGVMGGVEVSLTKKISDRYHSLQILVVLFMVMVLGNGGLAVMVGESLNQAVWSGQLLTPWLALVAYAGSLLAAMWLVVVGFRRLDASLASIVGLSEVVFAALFGWLVFSERLGGWQLVGGLLVVLAAGLPTLTQLKRE